MLRKTVYLAGPVSRGDLCENLNRATAAAVALVKAGFAPLCPHWSCYSKPAVAISTPDHGTIVFCTATVTGNDQMTYADWMAVDLPWVAKADALLRLPGKSTGADREEACAREHGVPVFHSVAELVAYFAA